MGFSIDNPVLNGLTDPNTGLPFNGTLTVPLGNLIAQVFTIQPGDDSFQRKVDTRACIGGIVSRASLIANFGLTAAQADAFFASPMTVRVNLQVRTRFVIEAFALSGLRLFGD